MRAAIPHTGRGKWVAMVLAALVVIGVVMVVVISSFQGRHIKRNAAAIAAPVTEPGGNEASRPAAAVP